MSAAPRPQTLVSRPRQPQEETLIPAQRSIHTAPEGTTLLDVRPRPPEPAGDVSPPKSPGHAHPTTKTTTQTPANSTTKSTAQPARTQRFAWLDALRGIAALWVVFSHLTPYVLVPVHNAVEDVFDPGLYGVLVFFLVSGYIVPASLERRGSIRTFWVSRVFRLYPLFLVAIGAVLLLHQLGFESLRDTQKDPTGSLFGHMFMLVDLLGGRDLIIVLWTLSYEMVFYLLLTALFTSGWHRRSGRIATAFAAGALLLGGILPTLWLTRSSLGFTKVAVGADILVAGGLALAVTGGRISRRFGAWLAAGTGLVLLTVNGSRFAYEGLSILAVMFTGTLLYRAERGQVNRVRAVLVAVGVFATIIAAGVWHIPPVSLGSDPAGQQGRWVTSVALAGLTFAVGFAFRKRRVPAVLAWLGVVSYSIYLIHPIFVDAYNDVSWTHGQHPIWMQVLVVGCFFAVVLACSAVTYYLVEAPMQRLGRRVAARLDARFGPDRLAARANRLTARVSPT
jgi:peptidoglycan/LPS O-acetylase OafA/YrhL